MNYLDWNNALAAHFFDPQMAHRPVYLYVTQELLQDLGRSQGEGFQDFIDRTKSGPPWIADRRLSLCGKAYRCLVEWRSGPDAGKREFPPYIAYLSLFVLAAGLEGDFANHAYYPRLRSLLGEDEDAGMPSTFDKMWELWVDLEEWSQTDRDGELGIFKFILTGDWQHVGLPIGQTLLSETERHNLTRLFSDQSLDPSSPPSDAELQALLIRHTDGILQRRTRRILAGTDIAAKRALVYGVASELEHWNGSRIEVNGSSSLSVSAMLRLSCRFDSTASAVRMGLRCKSRDSFPDAGLALSAPTTSGNLLGEEHGFGWSRELVEEESGCRFNASSLDWRKAFELRDDTHGWHAVMSAAEVRLFEIGASQGIRNYIETSRVDRNKEYLIAACQHLDQIREWGKNECEGFCEFENVTGLPTGWRLFRIRAAKSDVLVRDLVPRLALPSSIRILLRGGVHYHDSTTSRFFSFAPPNVVIAGPTEGVVVTCKGEQIAPNEEAGAVYTLPSRLRFNETIRIEATTPSGDRTCRSLSLHDTVLPNFDIHNAQFGMYGEPLPTGLTGMIGAKLDSPMASMFNFGLAILPLDARVAYLLGPVPGQVVEWSSTSVPSWPIAWAVLKNGKRGRIVPAMADPSSSEPIDDRSGKPASIRLWKKIVHYSRRRFTPPRDPEIAALWERYRRVARNV